MTAKVLLVGLDAADHRLVETWADAGRLPTIQRLRRQGLRGTLRSPPGLGDDAAWMSFATGLGPGWHGRFFWQRWDGSAFVPHGRDAGFPAPFWEQLADRGLRVAVIDVPKSPLGRVGDGLVVADWMPHGPDSPEVVRSPDPLPPDFDRWFADPGPFECDALDRDEAQTLEYERQLAERARLRCGALDGLLRSRDWDLFLAVFAETHCVGHQCWHGQDPDHPDHGTARTPATAGVIERVYRTVDAHLATLIEAAGPDATVIVFSLLGMGPNYSGTALVPEILARFEGRARSPLSAATRLVSWLQRHSQPLRRFIPASVRRAGAAVQARELASHRFRVVPVDLPTTPIRYHHNDHGTGGAEAAHRRTLACRELHDELLRLEDPATRRRLVREVVITPEAFDGPHAADFADLIVVWESHAPITAARSPRLGLIRVQAPRLRTGNHRDGGWLVACGPGITPAILEQSLGVTDLAPTVAARFGLTLDGVRGSPAALGSDSRRPT